MSTLKVENISFCYIEEEPILDKISFTIHSSETLGILGPNGGGKSTLMKILAGLLKPTSGNLYFEHIKVESLHHFPFKLISYVPQSSQLNTILPLRVDEYLEFARSAFSGETTTLTNDELLELVGVLEKKNSLVSKLSGGEKQRVLLARAMINKPKFLLLDEPTKGLDGRGQDQLLNLLKKLKEEINTAIIIVDHNINQIIRNCDQLLCLNKTSHWHDKTELLTKNVLEDIYHCELEHLLIHENDIKTNKSLDSMDHQFCNHQHSIDHSHTLIRRKK